MLAAIQLAAHLAPDGSGSFDRWGIGAPPGVLSQAGITWCTDFVASAYQRATGNSFTHYPNATNWLDNPAALQPGFEKVVAGPGSFPQAGDIIVLQDGSAGHVAIAVGVQLPQAGQPGWALVAQGHTTHALERWMLFPDGTLKPPWGYWTTVPGYIRIPALAPRVASRVQPITQADVNAGYDSQAQHDTWWNAVCSAAAFTEVARAWGIPNVTIGQVLDRLLTHDPPYLTVSGGLMSQDGWAWMAQAYHLQAQVAWHAYTFDRLVQQVTTSGVPIIIGMQASSWSHFVVVVGGDSTRVQIVDSSTWRMQSLPRSFFNGPTSGIINEPIWWSGETVILTPI